MTGFNTFREYADAGRKEVTAIADMARTIDQFLAVEEMIILGKLPRNCVAEIMSNIPGFKRWFDARKQIRKTRAK